MRLKSLKRAAANFLDGNFSTSLSSLDYLCLIITRKCNFKCANCDTWRKDNFGEMADEQWLKVLTEISEAGFKPYMEISGGEPLTKKDLVFKIAKEGQSLGFTMCLNTNGYLIDEDSADKIINSGLKKVKVSLYSLDEHVHDRLRGQTGAGKRAKEALEILKIKNGEGKIKIQIAFLLTKLNVESLGEMADYASKNDFELIIQPLDYVIERDYKENWEKDSDIWPSPEQLEKDLRPFILNKPAVVINPDYSLKVIYEYYAAKMAPKRKCLAPLNNAVIWPNGDVALCFRSNTAGNVSADSFVKIWRGNAARKERKRLRLCSKSCKIIGCNIKRQIKDLFC